MPKFHQLLSGLRRRRGCVSGSAERAQDCRDMDCEDGTLDLQKLSDALLCERDDPVHLVRRWEHPLRRQLELDSLTAISQHEVAVYISSRVFGVDQVEQGSTVDDARADCSDLTTDRDGGKLTTGAQALAGKGERHESAGNGCGARSPIGREDVTVNDQRALAEHGTIDGRAQ